MYETDADEFKRELAELCAAHDKPLTEERLRTFWRVLKPYPWPQIRVRFRTAAASEKFPKPADLVPKDYSEKPDHTTTPSVADQLVKHVMRTYWLTPVQVRSPWTYLHKGYSHISAPGSCDPQFEVTGVVIPADGEAPGYRVMVADMQMAEAA